MKPVDNGWRTICAVRGIVSGNQFERRFRVLQCQQGVVEIDFVQPYALTGDYASAIDQLFVVFGDEESGETAKRLLPGRFEFPNALRHHPRFREFWELPGMPELAAVRRANGVTARLPLPVEADE